jgi:hypothetical protein
MFFYLLEREIIRFCFKNLKIDLVKIEEKENKE